MGREGKAGVQALEWQVHGRVKVRSPEEKAGRGSGRGRGGQRVWLDPEGGVPGLPPGVQVPFAL